MPAAEADDTSGHRRVPPPLTHDEGYLVDPAD